jgi:hypothetical protein
MALFGPERPRGQCPFTGVERTSLLRASRSVDDPNRTLSPSRARLYYDLVHRQECLDLGAVD